LSIELTGGAELRTYMDSNAGTRLNPVYSASVAYHPFEQTYITLTANQAVHTSLLTDQITDATELSAALRQRLLGKLFLDISPGYRITEYQQARARLAVNRTDDNFTFSARLGADVFKKGNAAIFYRINDNSSSLPGFGFNSTQMGFELGYRF
jgi:hypothetical protein